MAFDYLGIALIAIHVNYGHFTLIIFGICFNSLGIFYMLKPHIKSCTLKILIAITVVDLLYLLVALMETLVALELVAQFKNFPTVWWVGNFLSDASVGLNLSLAVERYIGTCHAHLLIKHPNLRQAWIFGLTGVGVALAMDVPLMAGFVVQRLFGRHPDDATSIVKICVALTDFLTTLIPLFGIATSSTLTKRKLKKRRRLLTRQSSFGEANQWIIESVGFHVTIMFLVCEAPLRLLHALVDLYSYFCDGGFEEVPSL